MTNQGFLIGEAHELGYGKSDVMSFLKKNWGRPLILTIPEFYEWQFCSSPDGDGIDHSMILASDDGQLQGFFGLNRRSFFLGGRPLNGAELTTWVIAERVRGLGMGRAMLRELQSRYEVLMALGVSPVALPAYLSEGFRYVNSIPRYFKVIDFEAISRLPHRSDFRLSLIKRISTSNNLKFEHRQIGVDEIEEHHALHQRFSAYSREPRYLRWRYAEHPYYPFEFHRVEGDCGTTIVILRKDCQSSIRVLHVMDIFGGSSSIQNAISFIESYAGENRMDLCDVFCMTDKIGHEFWSKGWFSSLNDTYFQVPHLFHPVELRSPTTTSLVMWSKFDFEQLLRLSDVYLTKGDIDFDRPSIHYLLTSTGSLG